MHIAIDALLLKNQNGGTGFYTHQLIRAMVEEIKLQNIPIELTVFVDKAYNHLADFEVNKVHLKKIQFKNALSRIIWQQTGFLSALNQLSPDLLFCPFFIKPIGYKGKTLITIHDMYHHYAISSMNNDRFLYRRFLIDHSAKHAAHIIAISKHTKNDVMNCYGIEEKKISVVYNGVSDFFNENNNYDQSTSEALKKKLNFQKFILSVGIQNKNKNISELLVALKTIKDRGAILPLIIAGAEGNDTARLKEIIISLNLEEQVQFLGFLSNADLSMLYKVSTVFVITSNYEGFGLTLLEAMASGLPTIYANRSSLPEIGENAGIAYKTIEELSDALLRLWNDENERTRLSQMGAHQAMKFSWQKSAKETLALCQKLILN